MLDAAASVSFVGIWEIPDKDARLSGFVEGLRSPAT
jgi:hypothetical protein